MNRENTFHTTVEKHVIYATKVMLSNLHGYYSLYSLFSSWSTIRTFYSWPWLHIVRFDEILQMNAITVILNFITCKLGRKWPFFHEDGNKLKSLGLVSQARLIQGQNFDQALWLNKWIFWPSVFCICLDFWRYFK